MSVTPSNAALDHVRARHRFRPIEALPWLLAIVALFALPEFLALGTQILILILFALSLDLVLGYAGIITLGHAAVFGTGAYAAGLVSVWGWGEPITGLFVGMAAAAVVGFASGIIILRTHGLTLLMLTLATTILLQEVANARDDVTGGFDGLFGISMDPILGFLSFDGELLGLGIPFEGFAFHPIDFTTKYLYALAVLFLAFVFVRRLIYAPFGRALVGIRENVDRMHAIGTPVHARLVVVYTIAATLAGAAGALSAQTEAFVTPDVLSFALSGEILIMLILGGTGRLYGAFIGVVLFMVLKDQLAKQWLQYWELGVGLMLVLVVLFARNGLLGALDAVRARWRPRELSAAAEKAPTGGAE